MKDAMFCVNLFLCVAVWNAAWACLWAYERPRMRAALRGLIRELEEEGRGPKP